MEEKLRFAIREGGRTVGAGVVASIIRRLTGSRPGARRPARPGFTAYCTNSGIDTGSRAPDLGFTRDRHSNGAPGTRTARLACARRNDERSCPASRRANAMEANGKGKPHARHHDQRHRRLSVARYLGVVRGIPWCSRSIVGDFGPCAVADRRATSRSIRCRWPSAPVMRLGPDLGQAGARRQTSWSPFVRLQRDISRWHHRGPGLPHGRGGRAGVRLCNCEILRWSPLSPPGDALVTIC